MHVQDRFPQERQGIAEKKFDEITTEIDWLDKEYRSCMFESYGLFTWKKTREHTPPMPFFRLESVSKVKKLQECIARFNPVGSIIYPYRWHSGTGCALLFFSR